MSSFSKDRVTLVRPRWSGWRYVPVAVVLVGAAIAVGLLGASAGVTLLLDGVPAIAVLAGALGWGAWPMAWLGLGRRPRGQQLCVSLALGLGILSILTLVLGVAGLLTRAVAIALPAVGGGLGLVRLYVCQASARRPASDETNGWPTAIVASLLLLTLAFPLALMLFGATLPPGILWNAENRGYDVLEYHLQAPREYFDAGRIEFLPHNVYASFPQQMEMLYLLLMYITGEPLAGAIPAQILHALCGVCAVLTLAAWSPSGWPRRIALVAAGTVPWLTLLGSLAYVESGLLLFAAVAAGLALDHLNVAAGSESGASPNHAVDWRLTLAAGVCAGLAGGCKYTALVFVAVGLGVALAVAIRGSLATRGRSLAIFAVGVVCAFSPWLVRNAALAGNPVYPFAYRWFGGAEWSAELGQRWAAAHRPPIENDTLAGRLELGWDELPAAPLYGAALFLLAAVGVGLAQRRAALLCVVWFMLVFVPWVLLTHIPGRFALPAVVPLALLAARGAVGGGRGRRLIVAGLVGTALVGGAVNNFTLARVLREQRAWWASYGADLSVMPGRVDVMTAALTINRHAGATDSVWLVGDARAFYVLSAVRYSVVFNRDPWLEKLRETSPAKYVAWLRTQNVSHVVFSWGEIERLREHYEFPAFVTRDWAAALVAAGLRRVEPPSGQPGGDVEIYEVSPK